MYLEKAKPLHPPRELVVLRSEIPTGIDRLIQVAKAGNSLTPELARKGDAQATLILMLADVNYKAEDFKKSIALHS